MKRRIILAAFLAAGAGGAHAQTPGSPPPSVTVSAPIQQDVTEYLEYTGQLAATEYVETRARVSGNLHFKDGQIVRKGDLLVVIDPRPFEVELQQATALRDTAVANVDYTSRDVSRAAQLRQTDAIASYRGREAVKAYMRRLGAAQPTSALPIERWVADDDTVVAFGTVATRSAVTCRAGRWELAFRFDMRAGLIQRYHLYKDSLSATLLYRAEDAWTLDREGERAAFRAPNKPDGGPVRPPSAQPETGATR